MSQEAAAPPAAPAKSKKMLVIIVAVLVVAGGGGGAYWKFFAHSGDAAAAEAKKPAEPPAIVNFDPFVVNLSDPGSPRFLRVTLALVVEGEEVAKEFSENQVVRMKVRSSLLEMLSKQQAARLVTEEGKGELKKAIIEHTEHNAEELKVSDVLFTEFIVQ